MLGTIGHVGTTSCFYQPLDRRFFVGHSCLGGPRTGTAYRMISEQQDRETASRRP